MSLLGTFMVVLKADSSHVQKSLIDVEKNIDEVDDGLKKTEKTAKKTMNTTTKETDEAGKSIKKFSEGVGHTGEKFKDLAKDAAITYLGMLGLSKGIEGVFESMDYAVMIKEASDSLGMMVEDVDAFAKASVTVGGDAEGARDSLIDMAEVIGEAFADAGSAHGKLFKELKINLKDTKGQSIDALEGLLRLSDAVSGMDKQKATYYVKALGITDNKTVDLVLKGRKELEKMLEAQKKNGVLSAEQAEKAKEFKLKMLELKNTFSSFAMDIGFFVIPALELLGNAFGSVIRFFREHSLVAKSAFVVIAGAITSIMLPALGELALAAFTAMLPFLPMTLLIAGVSAVIGLLYEDIMAFKDGNSSFIGDVLEKYPILGQIFQTFGEIASFVFRKIIEYFKLVSSEIDLIKASFAIFGKVVGDIFDRFLEKFPIVAKWIKIIKDTIGGVVHDIGSILGDKVSVIANEIHNESRDAGKPKKTSEIALKTAENEAQAKALMEASRTPQERINSYKGVVASANSFPLNSSHSVSNSSTNNMTKHVSQTNSVNIANVTVETKATDAQGIAKSLGDEMTRHAKNLHDSWDSGILL